MPTRENPTKKIRTRTNFAPNPPVEIAIELPIDRIISAYISGFNGTKNDVVDENEKSCRIVTSQVKKDNNNNLSYQIKCKVAVYFIISVNPIRVSLYL